VIEAEGLSCLKGF